MPILQEKISTIILAAGEGKRMHSRTPKVLHPILGKPIVGFVLDLARKIGSAEIILVINDRDPDCYRVLGKDIIYAFQKKQLGSGDAARQGMKKATTEEILILCGDVPLLQAATIVGLVKHHNEKKADVTILTCRMDDPYGYGRVIRSRDDHVTAIVEQADGTHEELEIKEINAGVYFGTHQLFLSALSRITNHNKQGEFYLTDAIRDMAAQGNKVCGHLIADEHEIIGVNTKEQLAYVRAIVKKDYFAELMKQGVYIEDPLTTDIDLSVKIGQGVHIRPHTLLEGDTVIPDSEVVGPFVWIKDGKKQGGEAR